MRKLLLTALAIGALMGALLPGIASAGEAEAKASCKNGGWQELVREDGSAFTNQGACASYAAQGGTPVSPDPIQAACDAAGGTLEDASPGANVYNLVCSVPNLSDSEFAAFRESFFEACTAAGGLGTITNTTVRTVNCFGSRET